MSTKSQFEGNVWQCNSWTQPLASWYLRGKQTSWIRKGRACCLLSLRPLLADLAKDEITERDVLGAALVGCKEPWGPVVQRGGAGNRERVCHFLSWKASWGPGLCRGSRGGAGMKFRGSSTWMNRLGTWKWGGKLTFLGEHRTLTGRGKCLVVPPAAGLDGVALCIRHWLSKGKRCQHQNTQHYGWSRTSAHARCSLCCALWWETLGFCAVPVQHVCLQARSGSWTNMGLFFLGSFHTWHQALRTNSWSW